jgi:hypothetical protein
MFFCLDYPAIAVCGDGVTGNRFEHVFRSIITGYKLKNGTRLNTTDSYRQLEAVYTIDESLEKCQAIAITTRNKVFISTEVFCS